MQFIKIKPINNSCRNKIIIKKNSLSKNNRFIKKLLFKNSRTDGRSLTTGHITSRHKGGGCKHLYRNLVTNNRKFLGVVISIQYDPNRSSFISLIFDVVRKEFFYSLTTNLVGVGSIISSDLISLTLGSRLSVKNIPLGSIVHSISSEDSKNSCYARSAGTYGQLIQKNLSNYKIKLPSGKILTISSTGFCTLGMVSNINHNLCVIGKAGGSILRGVRPSVRGVAMNPVDHPHGGRTNGGRPSVTPWGIPTKGKPTVKVKK